MISKCTLILVGCVALASAIKIKSQSEETVASSLETYSNLKPAIKDGAVLSTNGFMDFFSGIGVYCGIDKVNLDYGTTPPVIQNCDSWESPYTGSIGANGVVSNIPSSQLYWV